MTDELDRCPRCDRVLEFQRYHARFGNQGYLYCGNDATVLTWDSYDPRYSSISDNTHPWMLDVPAKHAVERALRPCPCGGSFRFANLPRCPHCLELLPHLANPPYFVILAGRVDGDETDIWKPASG